MLCKFFYKNSFPASGALYTIHLLSLDCLLSLLASIELRANLNTNTDEEWLKQLPSPQTLHDMARAKSMLTSGADQFNRDPKGIFFCCCCCHLPANIINSHFFLKKTICCIVGVKYLISHGLVDASAEDPEAPEPTSLAKFFRSAPSLNPGVVGEYLVCILLVFYYSFYI